MLFRSLSVKLKILITIIILVFKLLNRYFTLCAIENIINSELHYSKNNCLNAIFYVEFYMEYHFQ